MLNLLDIIMKSQGMIDMYEERLDHSDWAVTTDDQEKGLIIWQRTTKEGLKAVKCQGVVEHDATSILKVICDDRYRRSFDSNYDNGHYIQRIADQTYLMYQRTKKVAIVAARDFVFVLHINKVWILIYRKFRDQMALFTR